MPFLSGASRRLSMRPFGHGREHEPRAPAIPCCGPGRGPPERARPILARPRFSIREAPLLTNQALDSLVDALRDEFRTHARGARVTELLGEYARAHEDWRAFALTSSEHYTRNLVARDEHFELMILCWGPGHESPIHNHEGEDCWMAVLDGALEELRYPMPDEGSSGFACIATRCRNPRRCRPRSSSSCCLQGSKSPSGLSRIGRSRCA